MTSPDQPRSARRTDRARLSGRLLEILVLVAKLHGLTVEQLTRLLYATSSRNWAGEQLRKLYRWNLLEREVLPKTSRAGSAPHLYRLSGGGFRLLKQLEDEYDLSLPERYRKASGPVSPFGLAHDHAVADFLIGALLFDRHCPEVQLVDWLHDRDLHRDPVRIELEGTATSVIPDAYLEFLQAERFQYSLIAEVDRGHHVQRRWREKIHGLLGYLQGGYHEARYGTPQVSILCLATPGERRANELRRWTELELAKRDAADEYDRFLFAGLDPATADPEDLFLAPCWRLPFAEGSVPVIEGPEASHSPGVEVAPAW
ncbi:hypothetical protein BH23CHL2_BH23CHL2_19680 [soil metagenome]